MNHQPPEPSEPENQSTPPASPADDGAPCSADNPNPSSSTQNPQPPPAPDHDPNELPSMPFERHDFESLKILFRILNEDI